VKRAILVFGFLLCSVALFAQVHGPAPSVNSFTGKGSSLGPAPSVTSLGPLGWQAGPCNATGCINPFFTPSINFQTGTVQFGRQFNLHPGRGVHGNRGNFGGGYVYSYGYPYPVYVPVDPSQMQDQAVQQQPEAPAPTMFDRGEYRPAPNPTPVEPGKDARYGDVNAEPSRQTSAAVPEADHRNMSPVSEEQIPVLIVYKDGHQREIQNYAIVGDTLYELGSFTSHKIKLADLDLKQTIEKNEQRGVDFNVPANLKPTG
jgi:hypothetical protein